MYPNFGRVFEPYFIMRRYLFYLSLFFLGEGGTRRDAILRSHPDYQLFCKELSPPVFPIKEIVKLWMAKQSA